MTVFFFFPVSQNDGLKTCLVRPLTLTVIYLDPAWMKCDLCVCCRFQGTGLSEWEDQVSRLGVPPPGGSHPLSSRPHLLLPSPGGGTGARGEADQATLPPEPAEPLPRGGTFRAAL